MAKPRLPPFFKVLVNDFTRQVKLPPYLVLKHGNILPKHVKLRISNGATWDVKIKKRTDGSRCFTRGWSEFVKDFKLVEGDYVCFYPCRDGLTLDVVVFGSNCYEKKMQVSADVGESSEDTYTESDCDGLPHFEMELKEWQKPRMPLYKGFVERANLLEEKQVIVEYVPTNYTLEVALDNRTPNQNQTNFRFDLAKGWQKFNKESGMEVGNTYSFTFNPTRKVLEVKPVLSTECKKKGVKHGVRS